MSNSVVLECRQLAKTFHQGELHVPVLSNISLAVEAGQHVAIVGTSGSGKSTLLHLLGGLDRASSGEVWLAGENLSALPESAVTRLRNQKLGFVYQFHHLLPEFTLVENVAMPLWIRRMDRAEAEARASEILSAVGLGHRLLHRPSELSGGERQRAAVARALVTRPQVILADEPTGNLDRHTAAQVFALLRELKSEVGAGLVMVTHDSTLAAQADCLYRLVDGTLERQ
jgi:lipoprotein-releasing system ATP-binding protein